MITITKECDDCPGLQEVLLDIECTLLDLSKNFHSSVIYGVETFYDQSLYTRLLRWKRIITGRVYNCHYPCSLYTPNELLVKARLLAYKTDCSRCPECEEISTTTTTLPPPPGVCVTYDIVQVGGEFSPVTAFNYIDCEGIIQQGSVGGGIPAQQICAIRGSLTLSYVFYTESAEGCITTTTTTTP